MAGIISFLAGAASLGFKTAAWLNLKYRGLKPIRFPAVIISVDNISFGGTGKTSMALALGHFLQDSGQAFAIITRGYKSAFEKRGAVITPEHSAKQAGDEAALFKRHFPRQGVYVGRNRVFSIERAINDGFRIMILDDGFQSAHIHKDIKIMLYNPTHPYFYLRHFKCLMKDEDYLLIHRREGEQEHPPSNWGAKTRTGSYWFVSGGFAGRSGEAVDLTGKKIVGFSGLGDNNRFRKDLEKYDLREFVSFPDHHSYTPEDLKKLEKIRLGRGADYLACTEKDYIKIRNQDLFPDSPFIYAQISIKSDFNPMEFLGPVLRKAELLSGNRYAGNENNRKTPG